MSNEMAVWLKNENSLNFLSYLMISLIFQGWPTPLKSVTLATRYALFLIFELQNFADT